MESRIKEHVDIPKITAFEHIHAMNKAYLGNTAINYYGTKLTYRDFFDEIDRYARSFRKMGVKKGDVVTICMLSEPEFMIGYYALNKIGATCNGVSINFLRNNLKKYTDGKSSDILFIYEDLFDLVKNDIGETNIRKIILCPIHTYMPEEVKSQFNKGDYLDRLIRNNEKLPDGKEYIRFDEFKEYGRDLDRIVPAEYDENRVNCYLYSSGTTGEPKCVLFTDKTPVALATMHSYIDFNEARGDKTLIIIPMYYATSLFYCMHLQLTMGKEMAFQPFYNRDTFARDLIDNEINHTVATISHYMPMLQTKNLPKDALKKLKNPFTGGEAVTFGQKEKIDQFLVEHGSRPIVIGGGTTELGSCAMVDYISKGRSRLTGSFLPGVKWKIIDPDTEKELDYDVRGEYVCDTPAMMKEYYQNPEKTKRYWWFDEEGRKYGRPGDIAIKVKIPTDYGYEPGILVEGRKEDSFIDNEGKRIYLFDIENEVSKDKAVIECKGIALDCNGENKCVMHAVIHKDADRFEALKRINAHPLIDGVKLRDSFDINPNTGKRDINTIKTDRKDFYKITDNGKIIKLNFETGKEEQVSVQELA